MKDNIKMVLEKLDIRVSIGLNCSRKWSGQNFVYMDMYLRVP